MTTLAKFDVTREWQEITGVSSVVGYFSCQNKSHASIFINLGSALAPTDDKTAFVIEHKKVYVFDSRVLAEKIWVKGINEDNVIKINKE